jgi:hemerythrin
MGLITWDQIFSVKVVLIDQQHQMLVQMINDLYDAMVTGEENDAIGKLIDRLHTYAAMHFARGALF